MTVKQTKELLERYYDGATTLDEERALRRYFARPLVPAELRNDAHLFRMLAAETATETSADFDARLLQSLEREAARTEAVPAPTLARRVQLGTRRWMSIAAVFVGLIACVLVLRECRLLDEGHVQQTTAPSGPVAIIEEEPIDWSKYEIQDEAALETTLAALRMTSEKLNQGTETVSGEVRKIRLLAGKR